MGFSMFNVVHAKACHRKCLVLKVSIWFLVCYGSVYVSSMHGKFEHFSESVDITESFNP